MGRSSFADQGHSNHSRLGLPPVAPSRPDWLLHAVEVTVMPDEEGAEALAQLQERVAATVFRKAHVAVDADRLRLAIGFWAVGPAEAASTVARDATTMLNCVVVHARAAIKGGPTYELDAWDLGSIS